MKKKVSISLHTNVITTGGTSCSRWKPTNSFLCDLCDGILRFSAAHSPPLLISDVVFLAIEFVASRAFSAIAAQGEVRYEDKTEAARCGVKAVMSVVPELVLKAEILPRDYRRLELSAVCGIVLRRFFEWSKNVLQPLVTSSNGGRVLPSAEIRDGAILRAYSRIMDDSPLRAGDDRVRDFSYLNARLSSTLGEGREESVDSFSLTEWLRFFMRRGDRNLSLLVREGNQLRLNRIRLRASVHETLGKGRARSKKDICTLDCVADAGEREGVPSACIEQVREPYADHSAHLADVRDLRDALSDHSLVRDKVDIYIDSGGGHHAGELVERLEELRAALSRAGMAATLQAAIIYSWGRSSVKNGQGPWTKQVVAREYGVTARQLDADLERAEALLALPGR